MILSEEDEAILYESIAPARAIAVSMRGFRDLEDLRHKMRQMRDLCLKAYQLTHDIEQRTRDAALRRLDDVHA